MSRRRQQYSLSLAILLILGWQAGILMQYYNFENPCEEPKLHLDYSIADIYDLNVSGVYFYMFYPLALDNHMFQKTGKYETAKLGTGFGDVFSFNETELSFFLNNLHNDGFTDISRNTVWNYLHFKFPGYSNYDFFLMPYLLISSVEIANSSTWITRNELVNSRWSALAKSDDLLRGYFGDEFFRDSIFLGGLTRTTKPIFTSIENITPSITEHFDANGDLVEDTFWGLMLSGSGYSTATALYAYPHVPIGDYWPYFHLFLYSPYLKYKEMVFISDNDNPRVSKHGIPPYQNTFFPDGHCTLFTNLVWYCDVLFPYAFEHIDKIKEDITNSYLDLDEIIYNLQSNVTLQSLQEDIDNLSSEIYPSISSIQEYIFDIQDLSIHCDNLLSMLDGMNQLVPFNVSLFDQITQLGIARPVIESRYSSLKEDYISTLNVASQMLAAEEMKQAEFIRQQEENLQWTLLLISIIAAAGFGFIEVIFESHWRRMKGEPIFRKKKPNDKAPSHSEKPKDQKKSVDKKKKAKKPASKKKKDQGDTSNETSKEEDS